jgi:peptidyl-Lys metalloendopeptidase
VIVSITEAESLPVSFIYDFTSCGVGNYKFEPSNLFHYVSSTGNLVEILADHQPTNLKLSGLLTTPVDSTTGLLEKRASFLGCSSSQQTDIRGAIAGAEAYALSSSVYVSSWIHPHSPDLSSVSYTSTHSSGTPRYVTWFGWTANL